MQSTGEGGAESIRNARRLVRVLDAFVRKEIRHDAPLLTKWETVLRLPARKRRTAVKEVAGSEEVEQVVVAAELTAGEVRELPAPEPVRLFQAPRALLNAG